MGFPVGYTELLLPKLLIHTLSILGFLRKTINTIFSFLGLPSDFLEPDISSSWSQASSPASYSRVPEFCSVSALLIKEILPVVKFADLMADAKSTDSCAVCLYEFEDEDEIRRLTNCRHIFHMNCLDKWVGYDQKTCPLCRTPVIPDDMQDTYNERLWAASGIPDFYADDDSHINAL